MKSKTAAFIKSNLPHLYFIIVASAWLYDPQWQHFNYFAFSILALFIVQAIVKNKIVGFSLGFLGIMFSLLIFLAVLSEYNDFQVVNNSALQLIAIGTMLAIFTFAMSVMLISTNLRKA